MSVRSIWVPLLFPPAGCTVSTRITYYCTHTFRNILQKVLTTNKSGISSSSLIFTSSIETRRTKGSGRECSGRGLTLWAFTSGKQTGTWASVVPPVSKGGASMPKVLEPASADSYADYNDHHCSYKPSYLYTSLHDPTHVSLKVSLTVYRRPSMSDGRGMPLLSGPAPEYTQNEAACRKCNKEFNILFARSRKCNHCGASETRHLPFIEVHGTGVCVHRILLLPLMCRLPGAHAAARRFECREHDRVRPTACMRLLHRDVAKYVLIRFVRGQFIGVERGAYLRSYRRREGAAETATDGEAQEVR